MADELARVGVVQGLGRGGVDQHHAQHLVRVAAGELAQAQAAHGMADHDVGRRHLGGGQQGLQVLGDRDAVARRGRGVRIAHAGAVIGAVAQALGGELVLHRAEIGGEAEGAGLQDDGGFARVPGTHAHDAHAPPADVDHLAPTGDGARRCDHDASESHIDENGKDQAR